MLTIREEQIQIFEERGFGKLCRIMQKSWPEECQRLGEKGALRRVKWGFWRARHAHGFSQFEHCTRYIHLAFLLDMNDFDEALSTPWAGAILSWNAGEKMKLAALEKRARQEAEKKRGGV